MAGFVNPPPGSFQTQQIIDLQKKVRRLDGIVLDQEARLAKMEKLISKTIQLSDGPPLVEDEPPKKKRGRPRLPAVPVEPVAATVQT